MKGSIMEPLLNRKSLTIWSMLSITEWEMLETKGSFSVEDKVREPMPADKWILHQLNLRGNAFDKGFPIMAVYRPTPLSTNGLKIQRFNLQLLGEEEYVLVRYRVRRDDVLIITNTMYLWLQGNHYVPLDATENIAHALKIQNDGYDYDSEDLPETYQNEIDASRDNIFAKSCYLDYEPTIFLWCIVPQIKYSSLISAEKKRQSSFLYPYQDGESPLAIEFRNSKHKIAPFIRYFVF